MSIFIGGLMRDGEVEAMLAKLDAIIALLKELCALVLADKGAALVRVRERAC
jgi:hypothetical protein